MRATLLGIPGSHPTLAAQLMLRRKRIAHRRVDLVPVAHARIVRALGFPGETVPALLIDGRRVQGSRAIADALDDLAPDPPLWPRDPGRRLAAESAERWADATLQPLARGLAWWAATRDRAAARTFAAGPSVGLLTRAGMRVAAPLMLRLKRDSLPSDERLLGGLAKLGPLLDRVDELVADGTLDAAAPSPADYQVATSVRVLLAFDDLRAAIDPRPAGAHARALVPHFEGHVGPLLPPERVPRPAPAAA